MIMDKKLQDLIHFLCTGITQPNSDISNIFDLRRAVCLAHYIYQNNLTLDESIFIEELQHMRAELTALIGDLGSHQQAFVERLAKAVDEKGQYKVAHSQRTAELSRKLCNQIGLNEKTTDLIYYAGLLQNIGKITLIMVQI